MAELLKQLAKRLRELLEEARREALEQQGEGEQRRTVAPQLLGARDPVPAAEPARAIEPLHIAPAAPSPALHVAPAPDGRRARLRRTLRDTASLREAFVLKELLDRPLAQRRGQRRWLRAIEPQ